MSYNGYAYFLTHGPMLESAYPYTARDGRCKYNTSEALDINTTGYVTVAFDDIPQM